MQKKNSVRVRIGSTENKRRSIVMEKKKEGGGREKVNPKKARPGSVNLPEQW